MSDASTLHSLSTAANDLKNEIRQTQEITRRGGQAAPDLHFSQYVKYFVHQVQQFPGGNQELLRRVKLLNALCGKQSRYQQHRRAVLELCDDLSQVGADRPTVAVQAQLIQRRLHSELADAAEGEPGSGDESGGSSTPSVMTAKQLERQMLLARQLLEIAGDDLTADSRRAYRSLAEACEKSAMKLKTVEYDGCWFLFHAAGWGADEDAETGQILSGDKRDPQTGRRVSMGTGWLEDVSRAVDSLVAWAEASSMQLSDQEHAEEEQPFVFAIRGDFYEVRAFGESGLFLASKGMVDIEKILRGKGRKIVATDLEESPGDIGGIAAKAETQSKTDRTSRPPGFQLDDKQWEAAPAGKESEEATIEAAKERRQDFLEERKGLNPDYPSDAVEYEQLTEKIEEIESYLRKQMDSKGNAKRGKGRGKQLIENHKKNIDRAIASIKGRCPVIGDHLEKNLLVEGPFQYTAPSPPDWSFE